jgi:TetR/AcrR family transcriptional regulator, fatty acid metabolism regulator protein
MKAKRVAPGESRKELILDAADRLLAHFGYKKMTVEDIAREAGIGKGTVYLHFASKEEVVLSHVDRIVRPLFAELDAIAAQDRSAAERLRAMLIRRVMLRFDAATPFTVSLNEVLSDLRAGVIERRERHFAREAKALAAMLQEGQRLGEFRAHNAAATARVLIAATNSLLPFSLSTAELGKRREVEATATGIADLLVAGLRRESKK